MAKCLAGDKCGQTLDDNKLASLHLLYTCTVGLLTYISTINHQLSQNFKLIENCEFDHLINILTLSSHIGLILSSFSGVEHIEYLNEMYNMERILTQDLYFDTVLNHSFFQNVKLIGDSELNPIFNVPNVSGLARILGCRVSSFPMKYLGLLLSASFNAKFIWYTG